MNSILMCKGGKREPAVSAFVGGYSADNAAASQAGARLVFMLAVLDERAVIQLGRCLA